MILVSVYFGGFHLGCPFELIFMCLRLGGGSYCDCSFIYSKGFFFGIMY
uniref:Uncharacterized protein n=1 Tax=Anguilla anguilla TaxID=7936 RepID=A0A0E9QC14_ANGAN